MKFMRDVGALTGRSGLARIFLVGNRRRLVRGKKVFIDFYINFRSLIRPVKFRATVSEIEYRIAEFVCRTAGVTVNPLIDKITCLR